MKDNITDWALDEYRTHYDDNSITKEDIFYYTYGILHHSGYRKKYQKSLVRGLPHIPMAPDFWTFCKAGMDLASLHLGYETCSRYDLGDPLAPIPDNPVSIKFDKNTIVHDGKKIFDDYSTFMVNGVKIYNNLPKINYMVNGRTPVGWLTFTPQSSNSGINRNMFRYLTGTQLQETIERLVHVGLESDSIIAELSKLEFEPVGWKPKKTGLDLHIDGGGTAQSML